VKACSKLAHARRKTSILPAFSPSTQLATPSITASIADPIHLIEDTHMAQDMNPKFNRSNFQRPARDLTAVRATLTSIRNDLQQDANLNGAATSLTKALEELAVAEHMSRPLPVVVRHWTLPTRGH
jgi:hypothetical protein